MHRHCAAQDTSGPLSPPILAHKLRPMRLIFILPLVALTGCASPSLQGFFGIEPDVQPALPAPTLDTTPPPPPATTAVTVDQFDTTSEEDRAAATDVDTEADTQELGVTVASLGPPAEPGIWLKTPLVTELVLGRITFNDVSIDLELRPSGGTPGSGSQISLAAMRLIDAPLTSLPEVTVSLR